MMCFAHWKPKPCESCARSERSRAVWQTPERMEKHLQAMSQRGNAWFDEEIEILEENVGKLSSYEIRDKINAIRATYKLKPRTVCAIRDRSRRTGLIMLRDGSYSTKHLSEIFAVSHTTVNRWVEEGLLYSRRWSQFTIFDEDVVLEFAKQNPWAFDISRMPPSKIKTAAELVNRRDPWLSIVEIGEITGMKRHVVAYYIHKYDVPHKVRPTRFGKMMVQASNIPMIKEYYQLTTEKAA